MRLLCRGSGLDAVDESRVENGALGWGQCQTARLMRAGHRLAEGGVDAIGRLPQRRRQVAVPRQMLEDLVALGWLDPSRRQRIA
jgi:hypothetical protein